MICPVKHGAKAKFNLATYGKERSAYVAHDSRAHLYSVRRREECIEPKQASPKCPVANQSAKRTYLSVPVVQTTLDVAVILGDKFTGVRLIWYPTVMFDWKPIASELVARFERGSCLLLFLCFAPAFLTVSNYRDQRNYPPPFGYLLQKFICYRIGNYEFHKAGENEVGNVSIPLE